MVLKSGCISAVCVHNISVSLLSVFYNIDVSLLCAQNIAVSMLCVLQHICIRYVCINVSYVGCISNKYSYICDVSEHNIVMAVMCMYTI